MVGWLLVSESFTAHQGSVVASFKVLHMSDHSTPSWDAVATLSL
jgi:hypothetical protein